MSRQVPQEFDYDGFILFWVKFPRHVAKQDALKAWNQVKPSLAEQEQMRVALAWQVPQWAREAFQFAPYPATYLRGRRWEDEPRHVDLRSAVGARHLVPSHEPL